LLVDKEDDWLFKWKKQKITNNLNQGVHQNILEETTA
jgi:hypothetical protein